MSYAVKEIFLTLQGEGGQAGRPAVFCRFAGCNLWTGREEDRHKAVCKFCDTQFVGTDGLNGGRFATPTELAKRAAEIWDGGDVERRRVRTARPPDRPTALVVCTGGEPLLQLDAAMVEAFHAEGFRVAVETNGTQQAPPGIDWLCVSPKSTAPVVLTTGNELKLVYPQLDAMPERFAELNFQHFFLQPMDGPATQANTEAAVAYCLAHPRWRLSLQTHKLLGIP
ncbi:MAG TPA: 7-carboxy-7-deazaguanine synthase [Gemmatimonadales bacterium]